MKKSISHQEKLGKCPACAQEYDPAQMHLLSEYESKTLLHVTCQKCCASMLIAMTHGQFGMVSLGVPTDLILSEVDELFGSETISKDQVLDVHEYLKTYTGGARELVNSTND